MIADFYLVAVFQNRAAARNSLPVNEAAVRRIFVNNPNVVAVTINRRVNARKSLVVQTAIGIAASESRAVALNRYFARAFAG